MENKRIMIIGCGGSGKSTLARNLGEMMDIPVIHLDKLFWRAGWKSVSKEEFDQLLDKELIKDSWIIDGNFNRTIPKRLNRCNTVIYLDYSRITCLLGVIKRVISNYSKTRADMGESCPEKFDIEFLKWVWNFNKNNRKRYYEILEGVRDKNVIVLHKRSEGRKLFGKEKFKVKQEIR
ncbi:topology modulation protein [Clostridium cibarium]|uniref:Topology modulation protein n=1 Tax=Clostridium cibarium TaxID=2762247 RepID=A0ABR8PQW7_9CLOT|nr:topology modulation protein [Clostridium cibarium]MBD7910580.1 topology modulation protein [Clostridium cibarium]